MNEALARWTALGGLGFAALFVLGFVLQADPQSTSDLEWASYFDDRKVAILAATYVKLVGGVCLFAFLYRLRPLLAGPDGGTAAAAGIAFAAGMVFLGLYLASAAAFGSTAVTVMRLGEFDGVSPETIRFSFHLGYALLLFPGMLGAAIMVAAISVINRRSRVFPAWFTWFGFVVAALALLSGWWVPAFAVPAWFAVASVLIALRAQPELGTNLQPA